MAPYSAITVFAITVSFLTFGSSGRDDPYITFSAAESIRDSGWLTNINGDAIEQSTSLLFTLILAFVSNVIPISIPILGWILGFLSLGLLAVISVILLKQFLPRATAYLGAMVVATLPPISYWAASGAEQVLAVAFLLSSLLTAAKLTGSPKSPRIIVGTSVLILLTFLTRPDVGLVAFASITAFALLKGFTQKWQDARRFTLAALLSMLAIISITAIRIAITGSMVPQPLVAKLGLGVQEQIERGFAYLFENLFNIYVFTLIGLLIVGLLLGSGRRLNTMQILLGLALVISLSGVIVSGGDWMEAGRFFTIPVTLMAILILTTLPRDSHLLVSVLVGVQILIQIVTCLIWTNDPETYQTRGSLVENRWELIASGSQGVLASADNAYNRWNADHLGDSYFLGEAIPIVADILKRNPDQELVLTSGQGGMIPYFMRQEFGKQIRFIDRFQLMGNEFKSCQTQPGEYGRWIAWNFWQNNAGSCAPELPDLVYSIGEYPVDDFGTDYTLIVDVRGDAYMGEDSLPQTQWLAARTELIQGSKP